MKREIREWHGKELDCRIYFMDNRYGCEVSLRVEGQEFYGSTLSFHEWGMCRFDIAEDAIKFAIANMEDMITRVSSDTFIMTHKEFFDQQDRYHKVAKWLKNHFAT